MEHIFDVVVEYAKVFDQEGKPGDIDRGDAQSNQKWLRELAKNPETKINVYFKTEEDLQKLMDSETFNNETTNPQTGATGTRIKEGNLDLGIGKYLQLKRKLSNLKEYKDRKTGEIKEFEAGGILSVTMWDEEKKAFVPYDYDEMGAPANGSEAKVYFDDRYLRPMNLGFTSIIEYTEEGHNNGVDF